MHHPIIKTNRLILRPWKKEDLDTFAKMNADPLVMEFFPSTCTYEESKKLLERFTQHFDKHGYGPWAACLITTGEIIGFIGLLNVSFSAHFTPAVEVGWRLLPQYWGCGYATEGAKECLKYGFETLQLNEIVSFTALQNIKSRQVMIRIGMHHNPNDDFDHPKLAEGHPLKHHVLYRLKASEWRSCVT